MTASETVRVVTENRVALITLDRPPLNVLDIPMIWSLGQAIARALKQCDVIVFQGAGPKCFSAGTEIRDHSPERVSDMLDAFHDVFRQLWAADCLTVSAVHGHCLGGGCELATFCDFVLATESARFGQPEIKLGCFPPVAMVTFPYLIGTHAALDLILTGRKITAREAQQLGLVTRVVPDTGLAHATGKLLEELAGLSPAVLKISRRALWGRLGLDFDSGLREVEELYLRGLMKTEDAPEGIRAYLEKRAPVWRGR